MCMCESVCLWNYNDGKAYAGCVNQNSPSAQRNLKKKKKVPERAAVPPLDWKHINRLAGWYTGDREDKSPWKENMKSESLRADASLTGRSTLHFIEQKWRQKWSQSLATCQLPASKPLMLSLGRLISFIPLSPVPQILLFPAVSQTLQHRLMPLLTTLGVALDLFTQSTPPPNPPQNTNRKVIPVMSQKLSVLPFTETICANFLCVLLCGSKIPLFQQRRMNKGLVKRQWETYMFYFCTLLRSSLGLFPFITFDIWVVHVLYGCFCQCQHDRCQQPQCYRGETRVRWKFKMSIN